jgi:hypothetical protein
MRGQGAMEYLMSYGWAILLVMMVGVAMWRMGVFNIGGTTPASASGFQSFKPLLATCEFKEGVWWGPGYATGFTCQFVNGAGTTVLLKNADIRINNDTKCPFDIVSDKPSPVPCPGENVYFFTSSGSLFCRDQRSCSAPGCQGVSIPENGIFTVVTCDGMPAGPSSPCLAENGRRYDVHVDLTYDSIVGGVTTTKHEKGTVSVSGQ